MGDLGKESGGARGWGWNWICIAVSTLKSVCANVHLHVGVWIRQADNWTAARSPGHPAAVGWLLMANAGLLPVFHKNWMCLCCPNRCSMPFPDSVYVCARVVGGVSVPVFVYGSAHRIWMSSCASKRVFTLYSCLCVSVFCSKQMFFSMRV